jgi:hypothetical protein
MSQVRLVPSRQRSELEPSALTAASRLKTCGVGEMMCMFHDTAAPDRLLGHRIYARIVDVDRLGACSAAYPGHAAVRQHVVDVIAAALASGVPEASSAAERAAIGARTSSTDPPST